MKLPVSYKHNHNHHHCYFVQVEHVIKEQNMLDVYDEIEGYFNLLVERIHLIAQQRCVPQFNFNCLWFVKIYFRIFNLCWWFMFLLML